MTKIKKLRRALWTARLDANMTRPQAADASGLSDGTIYNIETGYGKNDIGITTVLMLCSVYNIEPAELFRSCGM